MKRKSSTIRRMIPQSRLPGAAKLIFHILILAVLVGSFMVTSSGSASADVANGSFETGDLTGWETQGNVEVLGEDSFDAPIPVPHGEFFALLSNGGALAIDEDTAIELEILFEDAFDALDEVFIDLLDAEDLDDLESAIEDFCDVLDGLNEDIDALADELPQEFLDEVDAFIAALEEFKAALEAIEDIEDIDDAIFDAFEDLLDDLLDLFDLVFDGFGSPAPDNDPFEDTDGDGEPDNDLTLLSQTFNGGSSICFDWSWLTDEEDEDEEFDDMFFVLLDGSIILSGSVDKDPDQSLFPDIPTDDVEYLVVDDDTTVDSFFGDGRSPFATHCEDVNNGGEHTIVFGVADQGNHDVDSGLLVDNVVIVEDEPVIVTEQLRLVGIDVPAPGETEAGEIFSITTILENIGDTLTNLFFEVTILEYLDGVGPDPELANRDAGTPPGVGARLTVDLSGDPLENGEILEVVFDVLIPRVFPFRANADAFTIP